MLRAPAPVRSRRGVATSAPPPPQPRSRPRRWRPERLAVSGAPAPLLHMRAALLSDVHGNRHALEAVLAATAEQGVDALWCLGDLVGYGADPNACVALARERCSVILAGNHDLAVTGDISLDEFSRGAALAAHWTQTVMEEEHLAFLRGL